MSGAYLVETMYLLRLSSCFIAQKREIKKTRIKSILRLHYFFLGQSV